MPPRFLADENLNAKIIAGLLRREPSVDFQTAKAAGIIGLSDHEVLTIAEREGRLLVSHDRETMPSHFSRFIADSPARACSSSLKAYRFGRLSKSRAKRERC